MFKCVRNEYPNKEACEKVCPGKCKGKECKVPIKLLTMVARMFGFGKRWW